MIRVVGGGEEFWVWDRGAGQRRGGGFRKGNEVGVLSGGLGCKGAEEPEVNSA